MNDQLRVSELTSKTPGSMNCFPLNAFAACLILLVVGCERPPPVTTAPNVDFESRRAWGRRHFSGYFDDAEMWIQDSVAISDSLGRVKAVAPIGSPNERFHAFTDGDATMHLEVIGDRTSGLLLIPSVNRIRFGATFPCRPVATLTIGEKAEPIPDSGLPFLKEYNLESSYNDLLRYPADQDPDIFLVYWDGFQKMVGRSFPDYQSPTQYLTSRDPLEGLPDVYRDPLLRRKAELLVQWSYNEEAAEAYRDLATIALDRAEDLLNGEERNNKKIDSEIKAACKALQNANRLVPESPPTLKLARKRIRLQHWFESGAKYLSSKECLGIFFEASVRETKSFPLIRREVGRFKATTDPECLSGFYISDKNRYAADFHLILEGCKSTGKLYFRYCENEKLPPLDLFHDQPRMPDYPLTFKSPRWESSDGEKVKLSAKTGEPL